MSVAVAVPAPAETVAILNAGQLKAFEHVKSGGNILVTGPAGTGKSTLLRALCSEFGDIHLTASTGISALNIGGCTLHSWAGLGIGEDKAEKIAERLADRKNEVWYMIKTAKRLAIDEISMIDADLFQKCSDVMRILRRNDAPFGGVQLILFGDFLQLPPVAKNGSIARFAFESTAWREADIAVVVLNEIMRQKDAEFGALLSRVRVGDVSEEVRSKLRPRINAVDPNPEVTPVSLCTHNGDADQINAEKLAALPGEETVWEANDVGSEFQRKTLDKNCIAPKTLTLKVGAQVMLLWNEDVGAGLANGTLGQLVEIRKSKWMDPVPVVKFTNGQTIEIERREWAMKRNGEVLAARTQMPLRLAYAISIHKSQGTTLEKVRVFLKNAFADGQSYVALSRAKTIEGLFIGDISIKSIRANETALRFYRHHAS